MKRKVWAALRRPKDINGNSKRPKGVVIAVFRVDRDLMVSSYQASFGKGCAARKAVGVVLYVWDWVPVRDGASFKGSVVSTGPPAAVLLGHEIEGRRPWALGTSGSAVPQHGIKLGLGDSQAVWGQAAWMAGYRWARCCADVMRCIVPDLPMAPCWFCQSRELLQEAVWWHASCDDFDACDRWWCDEAWRGQ